MKKRPSFLLAFLITAIIANNYLLFSYILTNNSSSAILSRVIDGDTIELNNREIIRFANINAPEKNQINSKQSKEYLEHFQNKTIYFEDLGYDKYKRTLARVYSDKSEYLNLKLVQLGLTSKFLVREEEREIFAKAEKEAIVNEKGIWKHSEYYGCFFIDINKKKEILNVINNCSMSLKNWIIKDESRAIYIFLDAPSNKFKIHSYSGISNSTDIFWNSEKEIWNDDSDSLYLLDQEGKIAHYETY